MNPLNKAWFVLKELSSKDLEMASLTGDVPRLGAGGPGASTRVGPEWWEKWGHLHPHQDRSQENFDAPGDAHFHGDGLGDDSEEAHAANMSPLTLDEGFLPDHTMSDPNEIGEGFDDIAGNEEQMRPPTPKTPSLDYTSYMAAQPQPGPLPSSERQALMEHYGMPQSPPPPPPPPQRDAMAMLREKQMANIERLKAQRLGRMPGRRRR